MKLAPVLRDLAKHLKQVDLQFALVGGIATSARAEPRFTRDIDVAVAVTSDDQAEQVLYTLGQLGYSVATTVEQEAVGRLATARLRHPSGIICDIIFATCGVESEIVAEAELLDVFEDVDVPTATIEGLLAMKVLSVTDQRPRDLEDIRALLLSEPGYDENKVRDLLRLIEKRGFNRQQDLVTKWDELKKRFKASLG